MIQRQFNVYGVVQGVGFRYFTWRKATELGLNGTVRNLSDGSVLVIASGDESQVTALYHWLQQGPRSARVEKVLVEAYLGDKCFDSFAIS
ncbi:acylphosphatase [Testudinibacter sp. TR-2022]|uniref:acylphosphatase n=1 Tax=Testudinibacter sp. TR-2022 TaxID=2585029 RepID=UPI0011192D9C|nr:acylphosphatase [Testudinibacter sp. TR-2022]TNH04997.1 acylphosphatase [Pasteurellaceae bacterium Phil31]TNH09341.1 acylphosphatase [Testudinibacter sp. TR-2022]TNH09633.1 acylphosphatase [Testudinibacter sp. TR-2022]TNH13507.1 acylphosphatase [Testudinibacter sp. TR-2022]TNH19159.1 acylphosphatase [Testudinibacter sp. TR-2022]